MDELIHYYSVDVAVTFDIDLDSDQIDTELTSDIHDTFVEELQEAFNNNSDVELDDYDWGWDKEHDYIQYLYISSRLDKEAVTPIVEDILDSIVSFERTDELWDGTYYYERHGLDTPPYERVGNTRDYTYKVDVDTDILRFFETSEDGEVLVEKVTKNELKDRAKKHKKKQKGITTLNPNAGNVEYNIGMFNKMSGPVEGPSNNPVSGPFGGDVSVGEASGCCEALKLPEVENPYREFQFTKEEKELSRKLRRYDSGFAVTVSDDRIFDLYEDGELLESEFESFEEVEDYCAMYSSLTSNYTSNNGRKNWFVENNDKLLSLLRSLPKGTRFYMSSEASNEDSVFYGFVGITSPDIDSVSKLLKLYTIKDMWKMYDYKKEKQRMLDAQSGITSTAMSLSDLKQAGNKWRCEIADYAQSNDDADYRAGVYEQLNDVEKDEKVFMEEYDLTNVDTTYTKEVGMNDYFESMNKEDNE